MKIAFDLDDTLIPTTRRFSVGSRALPVPYRIFFKEELRVGALGLLKNLVQAHEVVIYTTSLRKPFYVKLWFKLWGVSISQVINHDIHTKETQGTKYSGFTKSPQLFGIDVLVDDSEGVKLECDAQLCKSIIVKPNESNWVNIIESALKC